MNYNEIFEKEAEQFYKDTGIMAPGKDSPLCCGVTDQERHARFFEWHKTHCLQLAQKTEGKV